LVQDKLIEQTENDYILAPLNVKNNSDKIIFINGFLTEKNDGQVWDDFYNNLEEEMDSYHYRWKSGNIMEIAKKLLGKFNIINIGISKIAKILSKLESESKLESFLKEWQKGKSNAEKAGQELGKYIYNSDNQFTLVGHSLGTVVIYNALLYLIEKKSINKIKSVNLLGGAIQTENYELLLAEYNNLNINNYYSKKDLVLLVLFNFAESILNTKNHKYFGGVLGLFLGGALAFLNLVALPATIGLAIGGGVIGSLFKSSKEISFSNPLGRNIIKSSYARNITTSLRHTDYASNFDNIFKGFTYQKRLKGTDMLDVVNVK
jgi:hypothetical protein